MTWKRVATALVLIPVVVGLVLFTPTWVVAIATAVITVLALWEYFALGEASGHRAYRVWTVVCAILFIADHLHAGSNTTHLSISSSIGTIPGATPIQEIYNPFHGRVDVLPSIVSVCFLFVLGLMLLTRLTKRPLVEPLPAAGTSSSALLLV